MHRLLRLAALLALMLALPGAAAAEPRLNVSSPVGGETILGTNVTIRVEVQDFELVSSVVPVTEAGKHPEANENGKGMIHLKLDLFPLVILDQGNSYTFKNVPPGEHLLEVELANNDHSLLSPPVVQTISFRTVAEQALPATGHERMVGGGLFLLAALVLGAGAFALRRSSLDKTV